MITERGKGLVARALANQIPSAFSYIALGVGAQPQVPVTVIEDTVAQLTTDYDGTPTYLGDGVWAYESDTGLAKLGDGVTAYASLPYEANGIQYETEEIKNKTKMNFEAFRVPVSGSSVLYEGGKTKIALSATLPSAQRYEFSEIGVFSAESNSLLNTEPPRMIYTFSDSEGWEFHDESTISDVGYAGSVSSNGFDVDALADLDVNEQAFFISADNEIFFTANRKNQRMRIYQDALLVRGDTSTIDDALDVWDVTGNHVHVTGNLVDLTKARPDDELKIALAVMNSNYNYIDAAGVADEVRVAIRFMSSEDSTAHATAQVRITQGETYDNQFPEEVDFENNGYYVVSFNKKSLKYTESFSWENVTVAQVFVEVEPGTGQTSADYYVAVDAIRFDSNNENNPSYGMVAYSEIRNALGTTEVKGSQTESQIEYKILLEIE